MGIWGKGFIRWKRPQSATGDGSLGGASVWCLQWTEPLVRVPGGTCLPLCAWCGKGLYDDLITTHQPKVRKYRKISNRGNRKYPTEALLYWAYYCEANESRLKFDIPITTDCSRLKLFYMPFFLETTITPCRIICCSYPVLRMCRSLTIIRNACGHYRESRPFKNQSELVKYLCHIINYFNFDQILIDYKLVPVEPLLLEQLLLKWFICSRDPLQTLGCS